MMRGAVAVWCALLGLGLTARAAADPQALECSALAKHPATANCELETTSGYLKVGVDGKEDNVNGRPLYYTSYQAKGVDKKALTALVVAGDGPGLPLGHVDNYRYLACHKGKNGARYKVVMYDPVGVGESKLKSGDVIDADHNSELLSVSYRGREFQTVAEHFADSRPYVGVGVGTGAATLVQCVLDCGDDAKTKLSSIVLASPVLDCDNYVFKLKSNRLSTMPAFYADLLLNAKTSDPFYASAEAQFKTSFECRISDPVPSCVSQADAGIAQEVYSGMWGPSALQCTGTMLRWTGHKQLGDVRVPTYAFAMEHDTVDPAVLSKVFNAMPKELIRGEVLPLGAHMPHVDAFGTWYSAMTAWLDGLARTGEFVNMAAPVGSPSDFGGGKPGQGSAAAASTVTVTADCPSPTAAAATATVHPSCPVCHCPVSGTDNVQASVIPAIAGFFVASLIMTPVGYGLHALVHHMSKRGVGVFAQRPQDQYHSLASMGGSDEES